MSKRFSESPFGSGVIHFEVVEKIAIAGDCDFKEEIAVSSLESLRVPFLGNTKKRISLPRSRVMMNARAARTRILSRPIKQTCMISHSARDMILTRRNPIVDIRVYLQRPYRCRERRDVHRIVDYMELNQVVETIFEWFSGRSSDAESGPHFAN